MFRRPWVISYFLPSLPCATLYRNPWYVFQCHDSWLTFFNKQFVVDYVFCDIIFLLFYGIFLLIAILSLVIVHFEIIVFSLLTFVLVIYWPFFFYFLATFFLCMLCFLTVMTFLFCSNFLYARSPLNFAHISRKLCRYPCIGILRKGIFHILWRYWYRFFVHLVKFHQKIVTYPLGS